ncbi:hypothetical protein SAY87_027269 [Trapa incisa]|uniref:DUF1685 family protein n=1 Tax=Trapa incisa TaxID=236973 RepID=A0AAN7H0M6_9MYRT|nr:hypothetical protein SAY87_027269 [Trapa incisa]
MHIVSDMASSSAEEQDDSLLELFDVYWFQHTVFVGRTLAPEQPIASLSESKRFDESLEELIQKSELSRANTLNVRSMSDRFVEVELGLTDSESASSPKSVLASPKLQPILSGKEVTEFSAEDIVEEVKKIPEREKELIERRHARRMRKKKKKGNSKSMSELEFEELKGFMDLGFVFSEQDRDSVDLISIIPGLQRLGKRQGLEAEEGRDAKVVGNISIQRPYLSEAWEILERRKKADPLVNWKVTDLGNEIAVKDQLKFWAHAVASTVR